jgi:hypothetical protein
MSGGKLFNRLLQAEDPARVVSGLGNGKLRKATWQALSIKGEDEKTRMLQGICMLIAAERFCGKRGGK